MSSFLGVVPLVAVPMLPPQGDHLIHKITNRIGRWTQLTSDEFNRRRIKPGHLTYPVTPPINDSNGQFQFIRPPSDSSSAMFKKIATSPIVSYTGYGQVAHERYNRNYDRYPNNYDRAPVSIIARAGYVSTFQRGTGVGVDRWGPNLPFMRERDEKNVRVTWATPRDDLRGVQRVAMVQTSDHMIRNQAKARSIRRAARQVR